MKKKELKEELDRLKLEVEELKKKVKLSDLFSKPTTTEPTQVYPQRLERPYRIHDGPIC